MLNQKIGETCITYNEKDCEIAIYILDDTYYISFCVENEECQMKMYPVSEDITFYIEDLAKWTAHDYIAEHELDSIMEKVRTVSL